jgi:flavin-dependent dehydrogenase
MGSSCTASPGGYCGISAIENGAANVCLLARESVFRGRGVAPFLAWMRRQNPRLQEWFAHAEPTGERWLSIAQLPFVRKGPVSGDLLMAGDAAALIAPLAGDGIAMALRSGRLAASCAMEFLQDRLAAERLPRRYAARWRRQFAARLLLARGLQSLMLRPRLLSPALRMSARVPPLASYLVAHTRGS